MHVPAPIVGQARCAPSPDEAALVGRVRGGHTIWYPAYELCATLAVRVALEDGGGIFRRTAHSDLAWFAGSGGSESG